MAIKKIVKKIKVEKPSIIPFPKPLKINEFFGVFVKNSSDISGLSYYGVNEELQIFLTREAAKRSKRIAERTFGKKFVIKKAKIIAV